jgi:hypothetical protein
LGFSQVTVRPAARLRPSPSIRSAAPVAIESAALTVANSSIRSTRNNGLLSLAAHKDLAAHAARTSTSETNNGNRCVSAN